MKRKIISSSLTILILLTFITIPIQNASGQFEPLKLRAGEIQKMILPGAESTGESYVHGWADAYGDAALWVTPTHLDFGILGPGEYTEVPYEIKVPENQKSGIYRLTWIFTCETLYSSTTKCEGGQEVIEITIKKLTPEEHLNYCLELENAEKYDDALTCKIIHLMENPTNLDLLHSIAISHMRLGDFQQALVVLNEALEIDPYNEDSLHLKKIVYQKFCLVDEIEKYCPEFEKPRSPEIRKWDWKVGSAMIPQRYEGEVLIQQPGGIWKSINSVNAIYGGDVIKTGKDGKVELVFRDGQKITLPPNSELEVAEFDQNKSIFHLKVGKMKAFFKEIQCQWKYNRSCVLETPNVIGNLRGTELIVSYDSTTKISLFHIYDGKVEVTSTSTDETRLIDAGQTAMIDVGITKVMSLSQEKWNSLLNEFVLADEITPPQGGGCLIATAAFGSELAPQVQMLRETRDNIVMQTHSGATFMIAFNSVYYTFAPTVADWERENPVFKEIVKATITPLITTLSILNYVNIDSEAEMLGYGIGVILLNVGMYFVAPAFVIFRLKHHKK